MKCPRCNSPAYHNVMGGGEFTLLCDFCGFYSARLIDHIHFEHPIFKRILLEPQGVIVTDNKNYQYFSEEQRNMLLKFYPENKGYTYYDSKKRKWRLKPTVLKPSEEIEMLFLK